MFLQASRGAGAIQLCSENQGFSDLCVAPDRGRFKQNHRRYSPVLALQGALFPVWAKPFEAVKILPLTSSAGVQSRIRPLEVNVWYISEKTWHLRGETLQKFIFYTVSQNRL